MAILYPTSLANLVVEVGTRHSHQILLLNHIPSKTYNGCNSVKPPLNRRSAWMSNSIQDKTADVTNPCPILHVISGVYNIEDEAFGFYHNHIFLTHWGRVTPICVKILTISLVQIMACRLDVTKAREVLFCLFVYFIYLFCKLYPCSGGQHVTEFLRGECWTIR